MITTKSTFRRFFAGGLGAAMLCAMAVPAGAEDNSSPAAAGGGTIPAPVIGVVDVDQIFQESAAAKNMRGQADKYQQGFQQEVSKEESDLRTTQQELATEQQRKTLSPEAFAEKARGFEASVNTFKNMNFAREKAFQKSFNVAMGQVQKAMLESTKEVAQAHGANVVLPRTQVMMFDDKMNMTKEIITVMDKKLSHVDFPAPKVEIENGSGAPAEATGPKKK